MMREGADERELMRMHYFYVARKRLGISKLIRDAVAAIDD